MEVINPIMKCAPMHLLKLWEEIRADLQQARRTLPTEAAGHSAISQYEEFIDHNELELACDMLELYAENHTVAKEFWLALLDASSKMGLSDRARRYESLAGGR